MRHAQPHRPARSHHDSGRTARGAAARRGGRGRGTASGAPDGRGGRCSRCRGCSRVHGEVRRRAPGFRPCARCRDFVRFVVVGPGRARGAGRGHQAHPARARRPASHRHDHAGRARRHRHGEVGAGRARRALRTRRPRGLPVDGRDERRARADRRRRVAGGVLAAAGRVRWPAAPDDPGRRGAAGRRRGVGRGWRAGHGADGVRRRGHRRR